MVSDRTDVLCRRKLAAYRCEGRNGSPHTSSQKVETDLEGSYRRDKALRMSPVPSRYLKPRHTVGPGETFPIKQLEVQTLVSILGVDQVGKLDDIKLLGDNSTVVDAVHKTKLVSAIDSRAGMRSKKPTRQLSS